MTTIQIGFQLPSEIVKAIDRIASADFESRAAWCRRVLIAELRKIEAQKAGAGR